jgi:hypothetical protein
MAGKRMLRNPRGVVLLAALIGTFVVAGSVGAAPRGPAYLTAPTLQGCNIIEFGQLVNGVLKKAGDNRGRNCGAPVVFPDLKRSYPRGGHLVMYLLDVTCGRIYFSDGTGSADHANITVGGTDRLDIADAGGGCANATSTVTPGFGLGNFTVVVSPSGALA